MTYEIRGASDIKRFVEVDAHIDPLCKGLMWASAPTPSIGQTLPDFHTSNIYRSAIFLYTKLNATPEGRSDYGQGNDNTHNVTTCFSARKRYRTHPAPLFCILFSGKTEKSMPAERQLRCHRNNGTSGESGKEFRACGAAGGQHPQGMCCIRSVPDGADGCAKSSAPTQGRKRPEFHTSNIQRAQT